MKNKLLLSLLFIITMLPVSWSQVNPVSGGILIKTAILDSIVQNDTSVIGFAFQVDTSKGTPGIYLKLRKVTYDGTLKAVTINDVSFDSCVTMYRHRTPNNRYRNPYEVYFQFTDMMEQDSFLLSYITVDQLTPFLREKDRIKYLVVSGCYMNLGGVGGHVGAHFTFKFHPFKVSGEKFREEDLGVPSAQLGIPCPPNWEEDLSLFVDDGELSFLRKLYDLVVRDEQKNPQGSPE